MELNEQNVCLQQSESDGIRRKQKRSIWSLVTLEPMWLFNSMSLMMSIISVKNFYIQRACLVDLEYSEDQCFHSKGELKTTIELESQTIISSTMIGSGVIFGMVTLLFVLFLAPWSDASGRRKPLIILPLAGIACSDFILLVMFAFPKVSVVYIIYLHVIPMSIGGHVTCLILASFNYIGDICYKTGRCTMTVMGSNTAFLSLFMTLGTVLAPILNEYFGLISVFVVCLILDLLALVYVCCAVKDVNVTENMSKILDLTLPMQAVRCALKERSNFRRRNVLLCIIIPCCNFIVFVGEVQFSYMYLRNRFFWTELEYCILLTFKNFLNVIGLIIIVIIFKRKFHMKDKYIGAIGSFSQLLAALAFMISYNTKMIFYTSVIGILTRGVSLAERPILNKQIVANEQGKISCVTAMLEKITNFIMLPFCSYLYSITLDWFPSCFLLISVLASLLQMICYIYIHPEVRSPDKENNEENKTNE